VHPSAPSRNQNLSNVATVSPVREKLTVWEAFEGSPGHGVRCEGELMRSPQPRSVVMLW
jgi:hypothetical protein